ncbi:Protein of unknown function [Pyronema omphalodes CBS 100304]|uniref:Uncharacterized protein n=1 Tax=Pyronema omphalodes (strain CBS 100304) TaxID=1076935 RepID=U4LVR0_PYROM|nr:Protein of unknown function [Pyronema omphalodes CBS 100304]
MEGIEQNVGENAAPATSVTLVAPIPLEMDRIPKSVRPVPAPELMDQNQKDQMRARYCWPVNWPLE